MKGVSIAQQPRSRSGTMKKNVDADAGGWSEGKGEKGLVRALAVASRNNKGECLTLNLTSYIRIGESLRREGRGDPNRKEIKPKIFGIQAKKSGEEDFFRCLSRESRFP